MKNVFFILTVFGAMLIFQSNTTPLSNGYVIGDKVDDFKLQNVDGEWIQFSDYMGEGGVVVIFTCNTCPYAQLYEDRINALHQNYREQGFPVLAINPNDPGIKPGDSFEAMKTRSNEKSFSFPYVFDAEQSVYPIFGATRTPHVFLVDNEMTLRYIGAIDDNPQSPGSVNTKYVEDAIAAIKDGRDPEPSTTKAIGCGIKARS